MIIVCNILSSSTLIFYLVCFKMVRMRQNFQTVVLGPDGVEVSRQVVQARHDNAFERPGSPLRSVPIEDQVLQSG